MQRLVQVQAQPNLPPSFARLPLSFARAKLCKHSHICHSALQAQPHLPLSFASTAASATQLCTCVGHAPAASTNRGMDARMSCLVTPVCNKVSWLVTPVCNKCLGLSRLCATSVLACHARVQQVSRLVTPVCNKCLGLSRLCATSVLWMRGW